MFLKLKWVEGSVFFSSFEGVISGSICINLFVFICFQAVAFAQTSEKSSSRSLTPQTVFTNSSTISINDLSNASPYPSSIAVSGLSGVVSSTPGSVKVTLNGFSHTFPDDVAIALVGPTGAALLLQDGAGDDPDMINVTYTLSDDGSALLPDLDAWTDGTYKPAAFYANDSFPSQGPGTSYGNPGPNGTATFSSIFGGTNSNA